MKILFACLLSVILVAISEAHRNHSGLLEGKMNTLRNRKHKKYNEHESSTTTEIIEGNNNNKIYSQATSHEKLLLSIQIRGTHMCTGIPVTLKYAFTTANCAIKVRMHLPDEDGTKVKIYYGEILGPFGYWTTVNGVTVYKHDPKSAILDESYQHRKLDFGTIRVTKGYQLREISFLNYVTATDRIPRPGDIVECIAWNSSESSLPENRIEYSGPPVKVETEVLDNEKAKEMYKSLTEFPQYSYFVRKKTLKKGNIGSPVIINRKLVGIIAHVDEEGSVATVIHRDQSVTVISLYPCYHPEVWPEFVNSNVA